MFHLQEIIENRQVHSTTVKEGQKGAEVAVPAGKFHIKFPDGKVLQYNIDILKQMIFFDEALSSDTEAKLERRVTFNRCNSNLFQAAVETSLNNKVFCEVLTEDTYCEHLDLYEQIQNIIEFLNFKNRDKKREEKNYEYLNRQFHSMTLKTARVVASAFEKQQIGETGVKGKKVPRLVQAAQEICVKAIYFDNEQIAESHFEMVSELEREQMVTESLLHTQKNDLNVNRKLTTHRMREAYIKSKETYLADLNDKREVLATVSQPMNMLKHYNVSLREFDDIEAVRKEALKSKRVYESYRHHLLQTLESSGADMNRTDLLDYLVGPKGFLLDQYGIVSSPTAGTGNVEYPFQQQNVCREYHLQNKGPWDLEEEIRTNLAKYTKYLPERLIKQREVTMQFSDAQMQMQKEMVPTFVHWDSQQPFLRAKHLGIICAFNGWQGYGISAKNFWFDQSSCNDEQIKGVLTWKGHHAIKLDLRTFHLIIEKEGVPNPDTVSTKKDLDDLKAGGCPAPPVPVNPSASSACIYNSQTSGGGR